MYKSNKMQSEFCKNLVVESTIKGDYADWCVSIILFKAVVMLYEIKRTKAAWLFSKSPSKQKQVTMVLSDKQDYLQAEV